MDDMPVPELQDTIVAVSAASASFVSPARERATSLVLC